MDLLIHHMVRTSALARPGKEALVCRGVRLTYEQLHERIERLALGLARAGLRQGERVGILLGPSVEQVVSIFAVSRAGGVFVPIHHGLFPDQIAHLVNDCGMASLIVSRARRPDIEAMWNGGHRSLRFGIVVDGDPRGDGARGLPMYSFQSVGQHVGGTVVERSIGRDLAAILYTSGSTGKPKGVMVSHANLIAGASIVSAYLEIAEHDRTLAALPFTFDAGLN